MSYNPQIEEVKYELSKIRQLLEKLFTLLNNQYNSYMPNYPQDDPVYLEKEIRWDKGPNDWPPGPSIT